MKMFVENSDNGNGIDHNSNGHDNHEQRKFLKKNFWIFFINDINGLSSCYFE